jgi:4-hydroxybenzoate polyprenyltransferase
MDPAHLRSPSLPIAEGHAVRRVAKIVAGWLLLLLGVAALALPGPGLLLLLAGLVVLSQEYDWAEKRVEPVKRAAFAAAAAGVRTVPRIAASAIGALALGGASTDSATRAPRRLARKPRPAFSALTDALAPIVEA